MERHMSFRSRKVQAYVLKGACGEIPNADECLWISWGLLLANGAATFSVDRQICSRGIKITVVRNYSTLKPTISSGSMNTQPETGAASRQPTIKLCFQR